MQSQTEITWNGIRITGTVEITRGDYFEPDWTEVEIDSMELESDEDLSTFLAEHDMPAEWKNLPKACEEWIEKKFLDQILDELAKEA